VILREYTDDDLAKIKELHRLSGFRYDLPDLSGKEFFSRRVVADTSGIGMAAFLRRTAEVFIICDPAWRNAAWRFEALRQLHTLCREDARNEGIAEANAFLPPQIAKKFARRLREFGWKSYTDEEWKCMSFEV